ncbi:TPA: hypothetical protein I6X49_002801 [Vibrio cholerae]|nr:hypothetical protein [Vibrio cholerae]HAS2823249.1 hypothetical protein [Vibrio cholerae]HAS2826296.1 hypothetical protein [Vibrio cholerae]HAS2831309.1 hypothetical protein [Vibrio cholerae]HAS2834925.1 hypothetical protein [Vibrio cholerae]
MNLVKKHQLTRVQQTFVKNHLNDFIDNIKYQVHESMGSCHTVALRTLPVVNQAVQAIYRVDTSRNKDKLINFLADSIREEMRECWQSGKGYASGNMFLAVCEWLEWNEQSESEDSFETFPYFDGSEFAAEMVDILLKEELPEETLTVYRGGDLDGWSWSTNKAVALQFANPPLEAKRPLYQLEVNTKDIITKLTDRNESEVVINPAILETLSPIELNNNL